MRKDRSNTPAKKKIIVKSIIYISRYAQNLKKKTQNYSSVAIKADIGVQQMYLL